MAISTMKEAVLLITRACNFRCGFCQIVRQRVRALKGWEDWKRIIDHLRGWGVEVFGISGGEPLLFPGLVLEIVGYLPGHTLLISNGSRLKDDPELGRELIRRGLRAYSSSVDPMHSAYDEDAGLTSLLKMQEWGCKDVTASLTIYRDNVEALPQLIAYLSERGIYSVISIVHTAQVAFPWEFSHADNALMPTQEAATRFANTVLENYDRWLIHTPRKYFENLTVNRNAWHCQKPYYIQVDADGKFMPCPDLKTGHLVWELTLEQATKLWYQATRPCPGCYYACEVQAHCIEDPYQMVFN